MKITKRQLRRIIRESCQLSTPEDARAPVDLSKPGPAPNVPSPEDYDAVRDFMNSNPEIVDLGIGMVMDVVGASCERSTAQAIIDHLQGMLHGKDTLQPADIQAMMLAPEVLATGGA